MLETGQVGEAQIELAGLVFLCEFKYFFWGHVIFLGWIH